MDDNGHPVALRDAREAAAALTGVAVRTPLLENPDVNEALGARLLIRAESAQRTSAYKIVTEPDAAVGIAAALNGQIDIAGKTVAIAVAGGSIDPERFCRLIHANTE